MIFSPNGANRSQLSLYRHKNKILQKCRQTILLVQICFRFQVSLNILKKQSKSEQPRKFSELFDFIFTRGYLKSFLPQDFQFFIKIYKSRKFGAIWLGSFQASSLNVKKQEKNILKKLANRSQLSLMGLKSNFQTMWRNYTPVKFVSNLNCFQWF